MPDNADSLPMHFVSFTIRKRSLSKSYPHFSLPTIITEAVDTHSFRCIKTNKDGDSRKDRKQLAVSYSLCAKLRSWAIDDYTKFST